MKMFFRLFIISQLISINLIAISFNPDDVADRIRQFLDIADFLVKSQRELKSLKLELRKIPLFVTGCKRMKLTDSRYPNIKIGNTKVLLTDENNNPVPKLDESGKMVIDENGKVVYQKLTVDCNNLKDALSGISKSLDFLKTNVLGSTEHPNGMFIKILNILGLQDKIPSVSDLSETIDGMQYFIERVDKVMKIPGATPAAGEPATEQKVKPATEQKVKPEIEKKVEPAVSATEHKKL